MRKTILYVDGFHLYHCLVRNTPYKWLKVRQLAELVVKDADIQAIHYFTARAKPRPNDAFIAARQETYFRAIRTLPNLTIHLGLIPDTSNWMRPANPQPPGGPNFARYFEPKKRVQTSISRRNF